MPEDHTNPLPMLYAAKRLDLLPPGHGAPFWWTIGWKGHGHGYAVLGELLDHLAAKGLSCRYEKPPLSPAPPHWVVTRNDLEGDESEDYTDDRYPGVLGLLGAAVAALSPEPPDAR